ncbi:hypothetical protein [Burkholderia anthina]|uniref:hypothetical protein n=1 Tax=Burkholderia anthina TaxID=179879 RepID=UPI00158D8610|nr:hypothetical protein [Burkholderia anthina]
MLEISPQILLTVALFVLGGFSTLLWFLYQSVRQDARDALAEAQAARVDAAKAKADGEQRASELRVHVAENYVTQEGLTKALNNLNRSIDQLIDTVKANMEEMRAGLSEIHRRVDGKADK